MIKPQYFVEKTAFFSRCKKLCKYISSEISIILEIENKYCIISRKDKKTIVENVRASRKKMTKAACVSCFAMSERFGFMKLSKLKKYPRHEEIFVLSKLKTAT